MSAVIGQVQIDTAKVLVDEVQIELITLFRVGAQCHRQAVQGIVSWSSNFGHVTRLFRCSFSLVGAGRQVAQG